MTFLGQRFDKNYNAWDKMTIFNDMQDVVNLLELDETTVGFVDCIRKKIHYILDIWTDNTILKLKKDIQNLTIQGNILTSKYSSLLKLSEILEINPTPYLQELLTSIDELLTQFIDEHGSEKKFAEYKAKDIQWKSLEELHEELVHTDFISLLHEKIKQWSDLKALIAFAQSRCSILDNESVQYWDYNDIIVCSQTQQQLLQSQEANTLNRAFSLSGWMSNGIAQLWYIREHIKNWWTISAISWSSIGWIIWTLIAFAWNNLERIDTVITSLSEWLSEAQFSKEGNLRYDSDRQKILDVLTNTAKLVGIDEETRFNESSIAIVINASKVSEKSWEKEVYMWGERKVIESLIAWANMLDPVPKPKILWEWGYGSLLWETPIDGVKINDYAANEKWNPIEALEILWIPKKFMTVIDVWYSSETYDTPASKFSRFFFENATFRDLLWKLDVWLRWGNVIDVDARPSENKSGQLFNSEVIWKLLEIWKNKKREIIELWEVTGSAIRI